VVFRCVWLDAFVDDVRFARIWTAVFDLRARSVTFPLSHAFRNENTTATMAIANAYFVVDVLTNVFRFDTVMERRGKAGESA